MQIPLENYRLAVHCFHLSATSTTLHWARIALASVNLVLTIPSSPVIGLVKGYTMGMSPHMASSLCEWALVWSYALLYLSYTHELSHAHIAAPAVRLVHIDGGLQETDIADSFLLSCNDELPAKCGLVLNGARPLLEIYK